MKKLVPLILIPLVAVAWYLGAPLFYDEVVEEDFPAGLSVSVNDDDIPPVVEQVLDGMTDEEVVAKIDGMTAAEVDGFSDEAKQAWTTRMDQIGKNMPDAVVEDAMPSAEPAQPTLQEPRRLASGEFTGTDAFHQGSGQAHVYELPDGTSLTRFENFSVTNGPALSVWLVKDASGDIGSGYLDLGKLKGNKGSQNYQVPAGTDLSEYQSVIIRCVPFKVTFAVAPLAP